MGKMRRTSGQRVTRRVANLLIVIGGLVLAFPFWSSAYTRVQQGRLETSYRSTQTAFAAEKHSRAAVIAKLPTDQDRLAYLARMFADKLTVGQPVGHLKIPRLAFDRVVIQGAGGSGGLSPETDVDLLRKGPVHYGNTPLPGLGQPFAVAGHRTTYGGPFLNLDKMQHGDRIIVETPYARFTYTVDKLTEVSPSDVGVLADRGYGLVLTTCTPLYSATRRLIVWARLTETEML
jgi:sortase A